MSSDSQQYTREISVIFVKEPTKTKLKLIYKLTRSYMFRHYRVIFRQLVFITSPGYISISIVAVDKTHVLM